MTSPFIEKLAREARSPFESDDVADHMHEAQAIRTVRAILIAMREPSEEMKDTAIGAFVAARAPYAHKERELAKATPTSNGEPDPFILGISNGYGMGNWNEILHVWRAMIDAILQPDKADE